MIVFCGLAACMLNVGYSLIFVGATVLYFVVTLGTSSSKRKFSYITAACLALAAIVFHNCEAFVGTIRLFDSPDIIPYFWPIAYPVPVDSWTLYDIQRQCSTPIGGCIGIALGYLLTREPISPCENSE